MYNRISYSKRNAVTRGLIYTVTYNKTEYFTSNVYCNVTTWFVVERLSQDPSTYHFTLFVTVQLIPHVR